jgi:hypothetical protein
MSIQLLKITDPRDNLEKARRRELVAFAHANGLKEINDEMPAILIRRILRRRGLTQITIPKRVLGSTAGPVADAVVDAAVEGPKIDMEDDLARQYGLDPNRLTSASEAEQAPPPKPKPDLPPRPLIERTRLMRLAKARGIKCGRKDTLQTLKEKLGGQIAA